MSQKGFSKIVLILMAVTGINMMTGLTIEEVIALEISSYNSIVDSTFTGQKSKIIKSISSIGKSESALIIFKKDDTVFSLWRVDSIEGLGESNADQILSTFKFIE